jgi:hypothetical protein
MLHLSNNYKCQGEWLYFSTSFLTFIIQSMANVNQSNFHSNPPLSNQMDFLKEEASAKLAAVRFEMSIRNFTRAQQYIHEHAQLMSQMKELKEMEQLQEEFAF